MRLCSLKAKDDRSAKGTIQVHAILLNGTSSSGKTTLANGFLQKAPHYHYLAIDTHLNHLMETYKPLYAPLLHQNGEIGPDLLGGLLPGFVLSFHDLIRAYLEAGQSVIVDHVLQESEWRDDLLQKLKAYPVSWVGVFCALETLEQRERERGDREIGLAKFQLAKVHQKMRYDLQIATDKIGIEACITAVLALAQPQSES